MDRRTDRPEDDVIEPLPVPEAALGAHTYQHRHVDDPTDRGVRAIAAPVVAAELRRLADLLVTPVRGDLLVNRGRRVAGEQLRARADELEAFEVAP